MKTHKPAPALLLFLAGALTLALPVILSGCRNSGDTNFTDHSTVNDAGVVSIQKMGGDIDVNDAPHGADLSTMGGNIHLSNAGGPAKVKTMGGSITVHRASASVDASTMGGSIVVDGAGGAVKATTMAGDITARLVGSSTGERDVELSSNAGTILLTVPRDFPMEVQITLAYTRNSNRSYRIVDGIGLSQRTSDDWDSSQGTPRKYIRAEGRVGSGLNHVVIKTINGDVILKQE
jgi:hypothetical protein